MLTTIRNIIDEVAVRMSASTTSASNSGITDTILNNWARQAYDFATSYKKWPFTEGRISTTYTSTEEWNFEGFKPDSIRMLQIGGYSFGKRNFIDYQLYREDQSDGDDDIYSDYANILFINPKTTRTGTLVVYGQYQPIIDPTSTSETVFSGVAEEGNEAIVEEMLSYVKERQQKPNEALICHNKAISILENLWKRYTDEQFAYQTQDRGMFKSFDVLKGSYNDDISEKQF